MRETTETAFAKINLFLNVTGRRADGYHDLVSVMQTVSLADTLAFTRTAGEVFSLAVVSGDSTLSTGPDNLICRAAEAYFAASDTRFGVSCKLEKRIPMAAGLGGGSADAAATLRALDRLSTAPLGTEKLIKIAASIGADVPFCVRGGTMLCRGIGEVMTSTPNTLAAAVVVAAAGEGVSTPQAFRKLDEIHHMYEDFKETVTPVPLAEAIKKGDLPTAASLLYNCFEEAVKTERPRVTELKNAMRKLGARNALMSGSGPSVFGLFDTPAAAETCAANLRALGARAFACRMV